jgi:hypothetical protein
MLHRLRLLSSLSSIVVLSVAFVVILGGCGTAAQTGFQQQANSVPAQTASAQPSAIGFAPLIPQPGGGATLTWDPTTDNTLTVDLSLIGLAPASSDSYKSAAYPAAIGMGSCVEPGKALYPLKPVTANNVGAGTSSTAVKGVEGGIPAKDWHVALYAPGAANEQTLLACGPILNPHVSTTEKQTVKTWLRGITHEHGGEGAYGRARLSVTGTTLTVTVMLEGLAPNSKHDAHIHAGSCEKQGAVVHPLKTIVADANGHARVETTIQNVRSIPGNWYVNIHNGTDLDTQTGFQPIACGNVFSRG